MAKSAYLSNEWLMAAYSTADNLLVAKLMHDEGVPLAPELTFFVDYHSYKFSLFWVALGELFFYEKVSEGNNGSTDGEYLITCKELSEIYKIKELLKGTKDYFMFWEECTNLVDFLDVSAELFELSIKGEFTDNGLLLKFVGDPYYSEFFTLLQGIFEFKQYLILFLNTWKDKINTISNLGGNKYDSNSQRSSHSA
ncbi:MULTISPECIES: hypothetical protein [Metabacillus]|uniref:hypothetical protein n=1 Tax=Metabacillus TaxID=2675233 RepID=UPI001B9B2C57|nr:MULTISPECIES: hypothetical protein [Metabacillus]MCM3164723.1 hypothetical protein [Metabacillus litoralis]UGB33595.1 hypothetical protein LPC09_27055 [Metabacillus sp. B2-18]